MKEDSWDGVKWPSVDYKTTSWRSVDTEAEPNQGQRNRSLSQVGRSAMAMAMEMRAKGDGNPGRLVVV